MVAAHLVSTFVVLAWNANAPVPGLGPPRARVACRRMALTALPSDKAWLEDGVAAVRSQSSAEVLPLLKTLRTKRFFRLFAVDLLAGCSYMPTTEEPCELDACEVDSTEDVPDGLVTRDESEAEFELDSWARWDQPSDFTEYYDLQEVPESNTGYDGSNLWRFIHSKISFQKGLDEPGNEWKRDFNRGVSGIHSAVSASIIEAMYQAGDEEGALSEYRRRLRDEPDAIDNLHFAYMLALCAVGEMRTRLDSCNYVGEGEEIVPTMCELTASPLLHEAGVQAAAANLREHAASPTCDSWKMRLRTRDLLLAMNCVQCNLCRLHGKVTVLGFAATLQLLLGISGRGEEACNRPPDPTSLHRVEVAALLTTCGKLSLACDVVQRFQAIDAADSDADSDDSATES